VSHSFFPASTLDPRRFADVLSNPAKSMASRSSTRSTLPTSWFRNGRAATAHFTKGYWWLAYLEERPVGSLACALRADPNIVLPEALLC